MDGKYYTLRSSKLFDDQVESIGDIRFVDEALSILTCSIARNPLVFPIIPGFDGIRIAKTDKFTRNNTEIPPLRLWFRQIDSTIIELLAIEQFTKEIED